ncbi:GntR family transcriptional regulator [Chelatococcus reniformis]|uniref:GntR family transcriptional regulator n=1 Tax=Chelatococcus reniformis TaxID=1494448 RepID=A0A916XK78_9HYPH|nr:GntR family transcriptional regulator [Chelatococcus reniformis]
MLRANIMEQRLPRGLVLLEGPIAAIMRTSRAPVQRALQRLSADGLVHRFDGRGYLVGAPGQAIAPIRRDIKALGLVLPHGAGEALASRTSWSRIYNTVEADVAGCVVFGKYRIIETELAEHFRVSRTVVREVLGRLQERGLVRKNRSSHWIAGPLTAQTIKDHYAIRHMLEPPALRAAAPRLDRGRLSVLFDELRAAEAAAGPSRGAAATELDVLLIETCVLATPNEKLNELIRNNLLPVLASERLLRRLGLPGDRTALTEHRLIVELLLRGSIDAAAAMLEAHLGAALHRNIAQMKIVAMISEPQSVASYLTRVDE